MHCIYRSNLAQRSLTCILCTIIACREEQVLLLTATTALRWIWNLFSQGFQPADLHGFLFPKRSVVNVWVAQAHFHIGKTTHKKQLRTKSSQLEETVSSNLADLADKMDSIIAVLELDRTYVPSSTSLPHEVWDIQGPPFRRWVSRQKQKQNQNVPRSH